MANGVPSFVGKAESFMERLESYFALHKTADDMKVHVLVMGLTEEKNETVRDLVAPGVPALMPFDNVKDTLLNHYRTTRNKIVERT